MSILFFNDSLILAHSIGYLGIFITGIMLMTVAILLLGFAMSVLHKKSLTLIHKLIVMTKLKIKTDNFSGIDTDPIFHKAAHCH